MKSTSPPTAVYASPVATPGSDVRLRTSPVNRRGPSQSRTQRSSTRTLSASPFAIRVAVLRQRSAMRRSRLRTPASRVYSRMTVRSAPSGMRSCCCVNPCAWSCFGDEVALRDAELLVLRVAGELDDVHAVEQRAGNRVERVRGADEEHLREVERQVEVVVAEVPVLLRVEHLEHRARRVAAEVGAHLVDLVDQQHRIERLGVAQRADDRPRHRADVGAPVAADLGLVAHAADRDARELAPERARDRLAERRLADARRPAKHRIGPETSPLQLRDGEVLDDPFLDLVEVVVVLVEDCGAPARGRGGPPSSCSTAG